MHRIKRPYRSPIASSFVKSSTSRASWRACTVRLGRYFAAGPELGVLASSAADLAAAARAAASTFAMGACRCGTTGARSLFRSSPYVQENHVSHLVGLRLDFGFGFGFGFASGSGSGLGVDLGLGPGLDFRPRLRLRR